MASLEAPLLQGRTHSESCETLLSPQGRAADIEEPRRAGDLIYSQQGSLGGTGKGRSATVQKLKQRSASDAPDSDIFQGMDRASRGTACGAAYDPAQSSRSCKGMISGCKGSREAVILAGPSLVCRSRSFNGGSIAGTSGRYQKSTRKAQTSGSCVRWCFASGCLLCTGGLSAMVVDADS